MKKSLKRHSFTGKHLLVIFMPIVVFTAGLFISEKLEILNVFGSDKSTGSSSKPTKHQQETERKSSAKAKEDFAKNTDELGNPVESTPASDPKITLKTERMGSNVIIKARMTNVADGKCSLLITSGGQSFTQQVDVIYQSSFSSCAGFSVPIIAIGSGNWRIQLDVTPLTGSTISSSTDLVVK